VWEAATTGVGDLATAISSDEGKAELKALFDRLDKDSDGRVTGKEWGLQLVQEKEIMGKYFGGSTLKQIGTAFKRLDTNKDGSLSWDEFESVLEIWAAGGEVVAKMATAMATDEGAAEFVSLFEKLDKDADGKVSSQEWGRAVHAEQELMGKYFGGSTLKEIGSAFTRLDTNKDGTLTWEEFKAAFAAYTEKQAKAFEAFDGATQDSPAGLEHLDTTTAKDGDQIWAASIWDTDVWEAATTGVGDLATAISSDDGKAELKALITSSAPP
jgi:Ca2+-binding EF-hand superfamily protein